MCNYLLLSVAGGLGHHVVTTVGAQYLHKHHHFFFDNFFNSVSLQKELLDAQTYACGTIRVNRKDWPKDLVFNQKTKKDKKMKKGETRMRQRGEMVATAWQDKRTVTVLSTGVQPTMGTAMRQAGRGEFVSATNKMSLCYHFLFQEAECYSS